MSVEVRDKGSTWRAWRRFAAVAGPGIVVMLADSDAASVITAAQSGARFGYRLLLLQFALIPILYVSQELAMRLGIVSRKGHAQLIRDEFGVAWAWFAVGALMLACVGSLLTELSGLAGVGALLGVPVPVTLGIVVGALLLMAYLGSYLTIEWIAIGAGTFELVFLVAAYESRPQLSAIRDGMLEFPLADREYLYLFAANIGAVIMPWMIFYQQSAVVEKGLTVDDLPAARLDTAIGAFLTQLVMAAILIATAATLGTAKEGTSLDTVETIAQAITPYFGKEVGVAMFAVGISGAALVATIVVTLTAARAPSEVLGVKHALEHGLREAPWFYAIYTLTLLGGAGLILSGINLVTLTVGIQVMNAFLLPIVLAFLYLLARRLPRPHRLEGGHAVLVVILDLSAIACSLYAGLVSLFG
ncbi:Mn2+ and Fe2+ transporters of the NRAMP family [Rhizobiales bacterium GAS191]|nr:Mn2+ and Fe2+ transporters of the NRAMP family [Rhizobiales bacterium GAS191]